MIARPEPARTSAPAGSAEPATPLRVASPARQEKYRSEREEILQAAYRLIGQRSGEGASVQEILAAAGLSTRAFYRHFPSKDELILTMYRTAADRVTAELARAVAQADGPTAALEAWIRHSLAVAHDPRRARQSSVLSSAEARAAVGFDQLHQGRARVRQGVLAAVLEAGRQQGVFPFVTTPDDDARAVHGVVAGLVEARLAGQTHPSWADATAHTTTLFLRAFGATL